MSQEVITIDGPAASGKSSVARRVASAMGWTYVNTGAMYRAITARLVADGVSPQDEVAVRAAASRYEVDLTPSATGEATVSVNGHVIPPADLTSHATNQAVSYIARVPELRAALVERQRQLSEAGQVVLEGRDTGTVVCPNAPLKIFLSASETVREQRRHAQGLRDSISQRDKMDSSRTESPLTAAPDAIRLDTSDLSLEQVAGRILAEARKRFPQPEPEMPDWFYSGCQGLSRLLFQSFSFVEIHGQENLPNHGPALLVANHSSFFDPPLLGGFIKGKISYMARKSLFDAPLVGWAIKRLNCIPVDQEKSDGSSLKVVLRHLHERKRVLIFPEGTRSDDGALREFEPGTGFLVAKARAPVVPIRIEGVHETLPRGAFLPRPGHKIRVTFGEPWYYHERDFSETGRELYEAVARRIHDLVRDLPA